jgi:hypothetical protein
MVSSPPIELGDDYVFSLNGTGMTVTGNDVLRFPYPSMPFADLDHCGAHCSCSVAA